MLDEYRQRFAQFHTQSQREYYLFSVGLKTQLEIGYIYRDNSDLFSATQRAELQKQLEATAAYRTTERLAIQRLIEFAIQGHLQLQTLEIAEEIRQREQASSINWKDQKLSLRQAQLLLSQTATPNERHDLEARCADEIQATQDLWKERLAQWLANAHLSGGVLRPALTENSLDFEKLAQQAVQLLTQTESRFAARLKPLLLREAQLDLAEATPADLRYIQALPRAGSFFPDYRWLEVYSELGANLGFKTSQQKHVEIDGAARANKQARPFCAPVQIPTEIKLSVQPEFAAHGQHLFYESLLQAAGETQLFAWTSSELLYEFRVPQDNALRSAWGTLFKQLLHEPEFLLGTFAFPDNAAFRQTLATLRLLQVRRTAALAQYEIELWADKLRETAGPRFVELLSDATQVRHDDSAHLRAVRQPLQACAQLRGWVFEAQFREYLKTQFGTRWWLSRKAGEMLIDLWNCGQRYSPEELAALIGLGPLDFEWLGQELLNAL